MLNKRTPGLSLSALFLVSSMALGFCPTAAHADPPVDSTAPTVSLDTTQLFTVTLFAVKAKMLVNDWYPRIVDILGAQNSPKLKQINIVMDVDMDGVAATGGDTIHCSVRYVQQHPDDTGMIIHELTHAIQGYPKYDPVWLVEGIADYVRFYGYEPEANRPHPNPKKANCRDSYRTTAHFLNWASRKYDANLVKKLNAALTTDTYTEDMFVKLTGKNLDDLNKEWVATL